MTQLLPGSHFLLLFQKSPTFGSTRVLPCFLPFPHGADLPQGGMSHFCCSFILCGLGSVQAAPDWFSWGNDDGSRQSCTWNYWQLISGIITPVYPVGARTEMEMIFSLGRFGCLVGLLGFFCCCCLGLFRGLFVWGFFWSPPFVAN